MPWDTCVSLRRFWFGVACSLGHTCGSEYGLRGGTCVVGGVWWGSTGTHEVRGSRGSPGVNPGEGENPGRDVT